MKKLCALLLALTVLSACGGASGTPSEAVSAASFSAVSSSETASEASAAAAQAEADRIAAEQAAAAQAEADRIAAEQAAAAQAEADRIAAEQAAAAQAEADRIAAAQAEADRIAAEQAAAAQAEADRVAAAQATAAKTTVKATTATPVTGANYLSKVETKVLKLLNDERASQGLEPLVYNEALCSAARIRSKELYKAGEKKFAHNRPNGDSWSTVLSEDVSVQYKSAGENLCMTKYNDPNCNNATSAQFWFNEWVNSPDHYENIVRARFTHAGVGIYCIEKNGFTYAYATTIFAEFE